MNSRLPVSTSARRPTHPGDGSTSFVGLNRPSAIPVTVRKAFLFTPQTQKRPFQSGASTAGKSYMSSMTTDKKIHRTHKPVVDREVQIRMFDNLIDFLKTNAIQLPLPEAKKFFSSVSTTESTRIFQFLIGRLIPEFKIQRLETDVPEALALLEYPYIRTVTKSALVSITTRQAAVHLLSIFNWLIDMILDIEFDYGQDVVDDVDEPMDEREAILDMILTQPDSPEAMRKILDRIYPPVDVESKREELARVEMEIENYRERLEEYNALKMEDENLTGDTQKMAHYMNELSKYKEGLEEKEEQLMSEYRVKDLQIEELIKRLEEMRLKVKVHELDKEETENDRVLYDKLISDLNQLKARNSEHELRIAASRKRGEKLDLKYREGVERQLANLRQLETCMGQPDFVSSPVTSSLMKLRDLILRLERTADHDLEQRGRDQDELSRFADSVSEIIPLVEAELQEDISILARERERIEVDELRYSNDGELKFKLDQLEAEEQSARREHDEMMARFAREASILDRKSAQLNQINKENLEKLKELVVSEKELLEKSKRQLEEEEEAYSNQIGSITDANKIRCESILREAQHEAELSKIEQMAASEETREARSILRELKKHCLNRGSK